MKRIIILLFSLALCFTTAYAAEEKISDVFTDADFRREVCDMMGIEDEDDSFSSWQKKIGSVTELHLSSKDISSIEGIHHFSSLKILDISGNNISSVDLSELASLEILIAGNNPIEKIDLRKNSLLKSAYLENCRITEIYLPEGIQKLYLNNNFIRNIDLASRTKLRELNLKGNMLHKADLRGNTAVRYLWLADNHLSEISLYEDPGFEICDLGTQSVTLGMKKSGTYSSAHRVISSSLMHKNGVFSFDMNSLPVYSECLMSVGGYPLTAEYSAVDFRGDINDDGVINYSDLSYLLGKYKKSDPSGDIDDGGIVSSDDISILLSSYGETADIVIK